MKVLVTKPKTHHAYNPNSPVNQAIQNPVSGNNIPDATVNVASCFYFTNSSGDQIKSMQLVDYATAIGNKVCNLVTQITTINKVLQSFDGRITVLENKQAPTLVLPSIIPVCVGAKVLTPIDVVLAAVEAQFCQQRAAEGLPTDIFQMMQTMCPGLGSSDVLGPYGGKMSGLPGWISSPQNQAQNLIDLWLTVCDLRAAVANINAVFIPKACAGISVALQAVLTGTNLTLFLTGSIPVPFASCLAPGTIFTITDSSGAFAKATVNVPGVLNTPNGIQISLAGSPLNVDLDWTISAVMCLTDGTSQCQSEITYYLANTIPCPNVTVTPVSSNTVSYAFNHPGGNVTYVVELWDALGTTLIASQNYIATTPVLYSGGFDNLLPLTLYKLQLNITAGVKNQLCQFYEVITLASTCTPPNTVTVIITVP